MTTPPDTPPGIPWQEARQIAAARLDWMAAQWRSAGIDADELAGRAGPIATYATQADFEALRPEDHPARVEDHRVIVRAAVQEARRRYGLRLVPLDLDRAGYLAWLGTRENNATSRAQYLAEQFAATSADL